MPRAASASEREPLLSDPQQVFDQKELRKSIGKVNKNVLPFVFVAVFLVQGDKTFSNLLSHHVCDSLGLQDSSYKAGDLLFLVGYLLFTVPSNLLLERTHAGRYLGGLMLVWGLILAMSFLVKDALGYYVVRFLLGAVESGIIPGFWYYCTLFYPENELILPFTVVEVGNFTSKFLSIPVAHFAEKEVGGLAGWVWALIIDGGCGIVIGVLLVCMMPGSLKDSFFLNNKDAKLIVAKKEQPGWGETPGPLGWKKFVQEWRGTLLSGGLWACAAVSHGGRMVAYLLQQWAPEIIHSRSDGKYLAAKNTFKPCEEDGFHNLYDSAFNIVWLYGLVPIGVAFFGAFILSVTSRKTNDRKHHAGCCLLVTAVSLFCIPIMSALGSWAALYTFVTLALTSALLSGPPIIALASSFIGPEQKAVGFAGLNFVGRLGGYLGLLITNSLIIDHENYTIPFLFLGMLLLPCIMVVFLLPDPNRMKKKPVLSSQFYMEDYDGLSTKVEPVEDAQPRRPFVPSVASIHTDALEEQVASAEQSSILQKIGSRGTIMYPFQAEADGELSVSVGDAVEILSEEQDGWVSVRKGSEEGLVPVGYIKS